MCRKYQLIGCAVAAFGLGMLTACFIESGFLCGFLGVVIAGLGIFLIQKK